MSDRRTGSNEEQSRQALGSNAAAARPQGVIPGTAGDDDLSGGVGSDTITGGRGDDILRGRGGSDSLLGGPGDDTLLGGAGRDDLRGGDGVDLLRGGGASDALFGDAGDDRLEGQGGGDFLDGLAGNDILIGGPGGDVFRLLDVDHGFDRILDFNLVAKDKLDFRPALTAYGPGDDIGDFVHVRQAAGSTIVSINPTGEGASFTDVIRLEGVEVSLSQLAFYGMITAPLDASQLSAVQENPYNFSNVSDNTATPEMTPSGRFVAFASQENLDNHFADPAASSEDGATHDVFVQDFRSGELARVSVAADGNLFRTPDGELADFAGPAISSDGRLVAFSTNAALLFEDDNNSADVYLKNLANGEVTLVSAASAGGPAVGGVPLNPFDEHGPSVAMSANGRFVAFMTTAALAPEPNDNNALDVYVRDLRTDAIFLASIDSRGEAGGIPFTAAAIDMSADGRFVAFTSVARLDPSDGNNQADVYLWDRLQPSSAPILVSEGATPPPGFPFGFPESDFLSSDPVVSADGRFVVFETSAALVGADKNGVSDIYRYDQVNEALVRVSVDSEGRETAFDSSSNPAISADGRFVAFSSAAGDLVVGDTSFGFTDRNGTRFPEDIFVKDVLTGDITRASVTDGGVEANGTSFSPSLSVNGHLVAFLSDAPNLLGSRGGSTPGDSLVLSEVDFRAPRAPDIPDQPNGAVDIARNLNPFADGFGSDGSFVGFGQPDPGIALDFALRSTIDRAGDRDWFKLNLFGGHEYTIDLEGRATGQGTLADPVLGLYDANGGFVTDDDDGGVPPNAHLVVRPDANGEVYISAEGFLNATGSYRLMVEETGSSPAAAAARSPLALTAVLDAEAGGRAQDDAVTSANPGAHAPEAFAAGDLDGALANLLGEPQAAAAAAAA